ncbi:phosphoprotein phosphatase [Aureococcus anophagefferens]|nr:phosphoprotein phosphatase [Aureococcus anophagefferens]
MVESPTIKVDRRGLAPAPGAGGMVEPPSPMSHAKILARHATFAPRSEEEKAFGCPIPSPSDASAARAEGENEDPGRAGAAKAAAAASPRPAGRATVAASTPEKKKEAARRAQGSMLLEPRGAADQRVTLVLDLDETLVRSSFDTNFDADFEAPFNLNGSWCTARVRKRPFVDEFLARVADKFEVVIMTAGVRPCVDNSPNAYLWHPEHAIDVVDFVGDPEDDELKTIADFLDVIHDVDDVRQHVAHWRSGGSYELPPNARADAPNRAALAKEAKAAGN